MPPRLPLPIAAAPSLALLAASLLFGCATAKHRASGEVAGLRLDVTLDSPEAAYYLDSYLQGEHREPALHDRIERLHQAASRDRLPDRDELAAIADDFSTDLAALFFADRVARKPANAALAARFLYHLQNPTRDSPSLADSYARYLVLFAPSWDYQDNGHITGANLARPQELVSELGIENRLIPMEPNGSVETNAKIIQRAIAESRASRKRVVLVGASSAGPAIHLALHANAAEGVPAPAAWINLGGILQGSPLYERYRRFPRSLFFGAYTRIQGWSKEDIESMSATRSRARFAKLSVPDETLVINYVGLSLSGSLSKYSKSSYKILKREGPNDGLTPLADIIASPKSLTLIAPESDHFFAEDPRIDEKTIALAKALLSLLPEASFPDAKSK